MSSGTEDPKRELTTSRDVSVGEAAKISFDELRARARALSLREQLEREHSLLQRLNAASARLIQAAQQGEVFEALGEIIGNLIGSEEVGIFRYRVADHRFSLAWSTGVSVDVLSQFNSGAGLIGRAAAQGVSQFRERLPDAKLLPHETNVTACVVLKSGGEVVGVIVFLGLLPQKTGLEWIDFELLKFLETYGAVAVQLQDFQKGAVKP